MITENTDHEIVDFQGMARNNLDEKIGYHPLLHLLQEIQLTCCYVFSFAKPYIFKYACYSDLVKFSFMLL